MRARRRALWIVCLVASALLAGDAAAQSRARTQRVDPKTARISGAVTAADSGAPVRGAEVRVSANGYRRLATTDGEGIFDLSDLPAGEYSMAVSRAGFTPLQFGQRRPLESPALIELAEGEQFTANMALARGGAIYGHVFDPFGEPVAGTRVQVLRSRMVQGQRRLQTLGPTDQTDDTGAYRVYGLPPGDYYVAASPGPVDTVKRNPPIYYPGTPSFSEAIPLTMVAGAEIAADFQVGPPRNARVSGIVLNSAGAPVAAMVNLASEAVATGPVLENAPPAAFVIAADSRSDGRFSIENVPPGPYRLTATLPFGAGFLAGAEAAAPTGARNRQPLQDLMSQMPESGSQPVIVTGDDVSGLTLTTQRGAMLEVRFVADSGVVRPLPTGLRVSARSSHAGGMLMVGGAGGSRTPSVIASGAGPFHLDVEGLPESWVVSEISVDGVDVTDQPIDLKGQNASARIVLSDRPSSISGVVQTNDTGANYRVLVFPDDASRWVYPSRYVRATRTEDGGRFRVAGLPPNERYLALAVDYLEDGEEQDAQLLERLRGRAISVSLGAGEQKAVWLDLVSR